MQALPSPALDQLITVLKRQGYEVVGPTVVNGAIVYDRLESAEDLPRGLTDVQGPGSYRLEPRNDQAYFGYVVGPHSWKRYLTPPQETFLKIERTADGLRFKPEYSSTKRAFIGVRACELQAIKVQDRVFLEGRYIDRAYAKRRHDAFVVAVDCLEPGALCFCASMECGPVADQGFDLRLVETPEGIAAEPGTPAGEEVLAELDPRPASSALEAWIAQARRAAAENMGRSVKTDHVPGLLFANLDHPRWEDVAERCLSCGNCTSVCPTCFCYTVEEVSDLDARVSARERHWDSCFTHDHGKISGHHVRQTTKHRYRQWLTHKMGSWRSQFDMDGCTGCGRCIAWCPVGIDITEELKALQKDAQSPRSMPLPRHQSQSSADPLLPQSVMVESVQQETTDVVTLELQMPDAFQWRHGQFNMLSLPAIGDVPISISGTRNGRLQHTIRAVGAATKALTKLQAGDALGLRGPFGSSWPLDDVADRPLTFVAGGLGLAPVRSAIRAALDTPKRFPKVSVIYGTRSPNDLIYSQEMLSWPTRPGASVEITVDHADTSWRGHVGVITRMLTADRIDLNGTYIVCGPEIMMALTLRQLMDFGVPATQLYLSMERNMKCAAGFCGRCQFGPHFVCRDGPVFCFDTVMDLFGHEGF